MRLDEAIERYTRNAEYEHTHGSLQGCLEFRQLAEWLKDYKRLLEQQPCEDAISRQAVLDLQYRIDDSATLSMRDVVNVEDIEDLPPVTPQPKTGQWIEHRSRATGHIESVCSECGAEEGYPYNDYCGNCGAKMFEEQERSEG